MTASIMMVTYNRLSLTKQTLDNIFETTNYPFHLIIVDNNSTDGTKEYIYKFFDQKILNEGYYKGYTYFNNEKNLGIAVGRNQALKLSQDEWLVTIDNDVLLPKNWLSECIDILKNNSKFAIIGVNMEEKKYPLIKNGNFEFQEKIQGNLGTACMVFHRNLHKKLGYFNTEYGLYGEEDADFGMRVRVLGYKMGYIKELGQHIGSGINDVGSYREFKTVSHNNNLTKFRQNCVGYSSGRKPVYISFK